ncbi:MAG: type II secretion system protein, partial [Clostridiales bacterium]|nr:type II secretion system protein [Clostridiales bacterium]
MLCLARASARLGRDKRGFTLVELLAVMAVLAIIAAIAVPR